MSKRTLRLPQDFLSIVTLAVGFTLIALGFGTIFGSGIGMITGGAGVCLLQWYANK